MGWTKTDRANGFTLIELLVVISITVVLISLLVPSLSEARRTAQDAACLANVKSLGQAGFLYAADFKQSCIPQVQDPANFNYTPLASEKRVLSTYRWGWWADCLNLYLTSTKVFDCPLGSYRLNGTDLQKMSWGYGMTPFVYPVNGIGAHTSYKLWRIDDFRNPHSKFYFLDSGFSAMSASPGVTPRTYFTSYFSADYGGSSDNRASPAIRHNLRNMPAMTVGQVPNFPCGFNAVFFDGHASYVDWPTVVPRYFGGGGATASDIAKKNEFWLP
jgi:prepilin-type N-terminal cleavage/methylation domain-containing protein/prepilin-type processing-associated H-X9-DG protein